MSGALLTDSRVGSQQTAGTLACKSSMPIVNNMNRNTSSNGHGCMGFLHGCGYIQFQNVLQLIASV